MLLLLLQLSLHNSLDRRKSNRALRGKGAWGVQSVTTRVHSSWSSDPCTDRQSSFPWQQFSEGWAHLLSSLKYLICCQRAWRVVLVMLCSSAEEHMLLFLRISFYTGTRSAISLVFHQWSILTWGKKGSHYLCAEVLLCSSEYQRHLHECWLGILLSFFSMERAICFFCWYVILLENFGFLWRNKVWWHNLAVSGNNEILWMKV